MMRKHRKPTKIKRWTKLTKREKATRVRALAVLRLMHKGKSLLGAARDEGIRPETVRKHLGSVLYKRGRKWRAKKNDDLERGLIIYENGRRRTIIVKGNKKASVIGRYYNDQRKALYSGNWKPLNKYKRDRIKDTDNEVHYFETGPVVIQEIESRKEYHEFEEIYDTR